MKNWIKEIYKWKKYPFKRLKAYIGASGSVQLEDSRDYDFPMFYQEQYRYHPVQHLINNEHALIVSRIKREQKNSDTI